MEDLVKNTRFDNLVNYNCSSNSGLASIVISSSSDPNSKAEILKNNIMIEYHNLTDDFNKIIDSPKIIE
jgi:hypothetical protein